MRREIGEYIEFDPFAGDKGGLPVRCRNVRVVKVRKPQFCGGNDQGEEHTLPPGALARRESAVVDGEWKTYHYCVDCIDRWLDEVEGVGAATG